MSRRRRTTLTLSVLLTWHLVARAEPPAPGAAPAAATALRPESFASGISSDTDLLLLPAARRPPARPFVVAATRVAARANEVATVFLTPASLREALPALIRADVVGSRPGARPDAWPDRLIAWEVEVPLFNLSGKAWLQQRPDGAELTLEQGAFAPGTIRFRVAPAPDGNQGTILTCEMQVEVRSSNWIFRRVARHDPWAETAMSAAMVWVVARAVGLRAEAAPGQVPARPRSAVEPPRAEVLDGTPLVQPALAGLRAAGTLVSVRRAPGGRLAWSSVAAPARGSPAGVWSRLSSPENWTAFPGWKAVKRRPPFRSADRASAQPLVIEVKDDIALIDLDAAWAVELTPFVRATAVEGNTRGAVFAWQVWPGDTIGTSLAVLSMHPRLDAAGFIERKLVAAEPLLEHALALAITYADAAAMADR